MVSSQKISIHPIKITTSLWVRSSWQLNSARIEAVFVKFTVGQLNFRVFWTLSGQSFQEKHLMVVLSNMLK